MIVDAKRALVIEDEAIVAMLIEDLLQDLGCEIAGSAATACEAVRLARTCEADFALLDVNLGDGQTSAAAADVLRCRRVPYAWLTGYGVQGVPAGHDDVPLLTKPIHLGLLAAVVRGFG
ncbi:response regulator [Phenylobacterium sp.]|uniref:response regulator n=1 Tax=Phenylobacterium sp. TaxID=1871053 RepID=UPI0035B29A6E